MPDENNNSIYFCTNPRFDLRKYWMVMQKMDPGFEDVLRNGGVDRALEYFHLQRNLDPGVLLFAGRQMNSVGYAYLNRRQVKEAITLFQMNVEAYPGSSNVYDSLGESLMADRQYVLAVRSYARSIEPNPGNENGRKKLEELKGLMAGQPAPSF
jgi:tetratricopeptide (TPR) repeat protein